MSQDDFMAGETYNMSLQDFQRALAGGDHQSDAVKEKRCLKPPIGCGQMLLTPDGLPVFNFDTKEEADLYEREWRITGLCPPCQDKVQETAERLEEEG